MDIFSIFFLCLLAIMAIPIAYGIGRLVLWVLVGIFCAIVAGVGTLIYWPIASILQSKKKMKGAAGSRGI